MSEDPVLSADFAERVLVRADVVISRRRSVQRAIVGITALTFVSVAAISWAVMSGTSQSPAPRPGTQPIALAGTQETAQAEEPDALSDLFPDAASVADFATEYSDATSAPDTSLLSEEDPASP